MILAALVTPWCGDDRAVWDLAAGAVSYRVELVTATGPPAVAIVPAPPVLVGCAFDAGAELCIEAVGASGELGPRTCIPWDPGAQWDQDVEQFAPPCPSGSVCVELGPRGRCLGWAAADPACAPPVGGLHVWAGP